MSTYLNPELRSYFEMLPIEAKNYILASDATINSMDDLLQCVDELIYGGAQG